MSVVRAENVSKEYVLGKQRVEALKGIDLLVRNSEFLAIAGPSGSGKSTLLNLIGLIDTPTSGVLEVSGQDVTGQSPDQLAGLRSHTIGFVFQTFNLLPVLTAQENVEYPLLLHKELGKEQRRERGEHYLDIVGLVKHAHHRPNELSGGQRQRVAIARALATQPKIVLADEPTANLDHKTGDEAGVTFIFSTHDPKVMALADRVVYLMDGELTDRVGGVGNG
jgi:putative ABC transport system ATP-binding protein